jgi:hypothetical protein
MDLFKANASLLNATDIYLCSLILDKAANVEELGEEVSNKCVSNDINSSTFVKGFPIVYDNC